MKYTIEVTKDGETWRALATVDEEKLAHAEQVAMGDKLGAVEVRVRAGDRVLYGFARHGAEWGPVIYD